jgi:hypothetical protein
VNQEKNDELQMLTDVQQFFKIPANNAKIAPIQDIVDGILELDGRITVITAHKAITDADTTGIRGNKINMRKNVVEDILILSGPLANRGRKTNNLQLVQAYNFTKHALSKMRDQDLLTAAQNTANDAGTHILALASAGVTPAMVTTLNNDRASLLLVVATPAQARQQKKAANQIITAEFPKTREVIDITLTPLMRTNFAKSDPLFYQSYLASTLITDTGKRHYDFFGLVANSVDGLLVQKVLVRVIDVNGNEVAKDLTGPKGRFRFPEIPQGTYSVELSRPGYQTKIISNIAIVDGLSTKKAFTIVPV